VPVGDFTTPPAAKTDPVINSTAKAATNKINTLLFSLFTGALSLIFDLRKAIRNFIEQTDKLFCFIFCQAFFHILEELCSNRHGCFPFPFAFC
jgi:hypothetical protein